VDAHAIDLPKRKAEDAVPAYVAAIAALPPVAQSARLVVGGHSYGGRVASLLAAGVNVPAAGRPRIAGVVCFSYPLHLPGQPEKGLRTEHWPSIAQPMLVLEGESDPFARIDLLRGSIPLLSRGSLVTWPRLGHGLLPVLDQALDAVVAWLDAQSIG
ncbi:MAG TPA: alpha/beta family hydrolase, partial [Candidatus Saccharimonadia bacterium]|nr:alpha/beta family hydrolase [Candidatus Saccharimonadia bacterium]